MTNRKLIITREKKIIGCIAEFTVFVDGECYGQIKNGDTVAFTVSPDKHVIYIIANYSDGSIRSNDVYMPDNDLDYRYHVSRKSEGLWSVHLLISEDPEQASYNKNVLEKRQLQNNIVSQIDRVMKSSIQSGSMGERDFSGINTTLTIQHKNSNHYKNFIRTLRNEYYKTIATNYFDTGLAHSKIYQVLKEIASFTEENIATFESLKHYDYMITENNMINSVLSLETIEDLDKIRSGENLKELTEQFKRAYPEAKNDFESGYYEKSVNKLLFTEFSKDDLDNAKRLLLYAAMNEGIEKEASDFFDYMMYINKILFGDFLLDDNQRRVEICSVDMIIAETLRLHFVNAIDKINDKLNDFLNVGCKCFKIGQEQYNILINVFSCLNAYEQEEMVLEAMVSNYIERTSEQEERLNFLRTNKEKYLSSRGLNYKQVEVQKKQDDKLVYEYRTITWKESDIINYFDSLSIQSQTVNYQFVVNEWSKNINANGIEWEIEKVADRIKQVFVEKFDDRFRVEIMESGPTGDYSEYDNTTLIIDTSSKGYPWITFNIVGTQMMKNQVTLSVYAMYAPELDSCLGDSIIERNRNMCNKVLMLIQKQNPKINNFMSNVIDLIINELEKWINTQNENNIYS